jgi:hypothetical protein
MSTADPSGSRPPLRLVHHDRQPAPPKPFTQAEKRRVFKQMVAAEIEGGLLRYSRRRALLRYAEDIGLASFDANLLIAEAQHQVRRHEPINFDTPLDWPVSLEPQRWRPGYRLVLAVVTAVILDLLLIAWLIG